jgi:hypothetical protein
MKRSVPRKTVDDSKEVADASLPVVPPEPRGRGF